MNCRSIEFIRYSEIILQKTLNVRAEFKNTKDGGVKCCFVQKTSNFIEKRGERPSRTTQIFPPGSLQDKKMLSKSFLLF